MAWAVFHAEVNWSRPKCKFGFRALPKPEPQQFPRDFIEYAVAIGRATKVRAPVRRAQKGK